MSADSKTVVGAVATWGCAFAALLAVLCILYGFHGSVSDAAPVAFKGVELRASVGDARASGTAIDVRNATTARPAFLQLPLRPFQASDLGRLNVDAGAVPKDVEIALLWVQRADPARIHEQPLLLDRHGNVSITLLDGNPSWRGEIATVALGVKGQSDESWRVARVSLEPIGIAAVARAIFDDWTAFGKWDGRSINVAFGGREAQRAYLPLLVFLASAIALTFAYVRSRRSGTRLSPVAIALPFVIGWLALDLRWAADLGAKASVTWSTFAGKTLDERHLAMEDGDLYRTIAIAKSRLTGSPERIFVGSDLEYFRLRAAYHLYPYNALPFGWYDGKDLRPGDLVFLYQKADVRFDATHRALIWPDGSRSPATPIVAQTGAGLFRIQ
jgi:hypothetical protein